MQMIRLCFVVVCCISRGVLAVFMRFFKLALCRLFCNLMDQQSRQSAAFSAVISKQRNFADATVHSSIVSWHHQYQIRGGRFHKWAAYSFVCCMRK